jgi:peptidoglycan/LPS O-acetylase OafA/YrhL
MAAVAPATTATPAVARGDAGVVQRPRATKSGPFQIPSLDGLRAVSFMIVFFAHAGFDRVIPGGFGVTVFFFLSGYLITTLMRMEADKTGHVSLRAFYLRRALRILPPFYLLLGAACALTLAGALPGVLKLWPVTAQALHYSNFWIAMRGWEGLPWGTGVYWSLAVEEHFYLVFPALYLVMRRLGLDGRRQAIAFWAICAAVLAWRCVLVMVLHAGSDRTYLCSDTRVDSMLFGCALAVYGNPMLDDDPSRPPSAAWMRVALPIALATLLATFLVRGEVFRETFRYSLQGLALGPVFLCAIRRPDAALFRPLNLRPLRFVGTLSYSLYLIHFVVLNMFQAHTGLSRGPRAVVGLGVAVILAWGIYEVIEKPCARLRKRLHAGL